MEASMQTFFSRTQWALCLAGALALSAPAVVGAASDNERWNQGQAELQKNLPPGMSADAYRKKLEDLGYKVTSTNYSNPDYLEYEVVKGDQTWEVQIDVDDNTHKATKVDIATNMWKTDATERELERNKQAYAGSESATGAYAKTAARGNRYSDRDRSRTDQMIRELEAMPTGHDKQWYKDQLRQHGYDVTRINKDDNDELQLEAVKNGHSVQMKIAFDEDTGKAEKVDASSLWAESESTTRTREAQEHGAGNRSSLSSDRSSEAERHSQASR
jgi:uncharacterized protein YmfQ (DUF2313 family)